MRNILYEEIRAPRLPRELQLKRLQQVIREELTPCQRETLIAYYFQEKSILEIARERCVNKSTVWKTLRRAEDRIRRYLRY